MARAGQDFGVGRGSAELGRAGRGFGLMEALVFGSAMFSGFCQGGLVRFLAHVPCWAECLVNYIRTSTILKNKVDMDFARAKIELGTRTDLTLRDACSS